LIELVMVIVILGILAAVALPRFVDLSSDARLAAIQGAAGALTAASAVNFATVSARGTGGANVVRLSAAAAGAALIAGGAVMSWDATKFSITTDVSCAASAAGATGNLTLGYVAYTSAASTTATIICTG